MQASLAYRELGHSDYSETLNGDAWEEEYK